MKAWLHIPRTSVDAGGPDLSPIHLKGTSSEPLLRILDELGVDGLQAGDLATSGRRSNDVMGPF